MLLDDVAVSAFRFVIGLTCGTMLAVLLHLTGSLLHLRTPLHALVDFLRAIPIIALVPAFIFVFGAEEQGKYLMIALASGFPIFVNLGQAAVISTEQRLVFAGARATRKEALLWLKVPALASATIGGIRIAIGIAWISVVAAEMLGVYDTGPWSGGLGSRVFMSTDKQDYYTMWVCLALFGFLGWTSVRIFNLGVQHVTRVCRLDLG